MRKDSAETTSLWMTPEIQDFTSLEADERADVCVIGAGISGLTTAYFLSREGKSVVVVEGGSIGDGVTSRTTAHLSNALDDRYFELEKVHGEQVTRRAAESHTAAIETIESIIQEEGIECDFRRVDGFLFLPPKKSTRTLKKELAAAHLAGLTGVELLDRAPLSSFDTGPCLRFPGQGQFHPMKYLAGLAEAIRRNGGRVFTHIRVVRLDSDAHVRIELENGRVVTANAAVVATNTPFTDMVSIHTKQFAYRTYAIAAVVPAGSVHRGLYWDTLDPYHYVRLQGDDLLIVGGEDHKTGQEEDPKKRFRRLERWASDRFPIEEVKFRWSGQIMETIDGLAFIGEDPSGLKNVYIVTGDSGMGMTHGTIAGMLLPDLISGRTNAWADIYDPSRKPIRAAFEYVKENVNVAAQYTEWFKGGDVQSVNEIPPGQGAVINDGVSKIAVYRDPDHSIHAVSAVCTHLGCVVNWNSVEKSWDCPCHGSRFDESGRMINGPASKDLEPVPLKKIA
jgi:glycine/D-amino acid oxidase-like deaminating enzyme/nitrite reductase/ring-hydroxylating ferredoxin subunit